MENLAPELAWVLGSLIQKEFTRGKIDIIKEYECVPTADFDPYKPKHTEEVMHYSAIGCQPEQDITFEASASLDALV